MNLTKPDLILFDWDGTLVDSIEGIRQGINVARTHFSMPEWSLDDAKQNIRLAARESFPIWFGARAPEALKIYLDFMGEHHARFLEPMRDADELLIDLQRLNIAAGVVSNKTHKLLMREVDVLGWQPFFAVTVGAGVAVRDKPAPDSILYAIGQIAEVPQTIWYVGDTDTDMQAAAASGCKKIFISHGMGEVATATREQVDLCVLDCSDFRQKLNENFV